MDTTSSTRLSAPQPFLSAWLMMLAALAVAGVLSVAVFMVIIGSSERRMASVRMGMTRTEVTAALGEPRAVHTENGIPWWSYADWWTKDANVFFDEAGRVRAIETD